jgi:hypothetical protein
MPALGDLFAPAYNPTDPQSMQAVQTWMDRNQGIGPAQVEQTRMPSSVNTGNAAGMVDPAALRSLAQGGPYDLEARRNAIAAQVQANQAAAAAPAMNPLAAYWQQLGFRGSAPPPGSSSGPGDFRFNFGPGAAADPAQYNAPNFSA